MARKMLCIITLTSGRCIRAHKWDEDGVKEFLEVFGKEGEQQLINKRHIAAIRPIADDEDPDRFGFYV